MPLFFIKRELITWIENGKKTIEIRKGPASRGEVAVFQSGKRHVRLLILKKETGALAEIIRQDNYRNIIPSAENLQDAISYVRDLYKTDEGFFTAYYVGNLR